MNYPTLESLFLNPTRIRVIKFFIRSVDGSFGKQDISKRLNIRKNALEREMKFLVANGFLKTKRNGKELIYNLNNKFYLYPEIKNLVERSMPISEDDLISKLHSLGKVQLALIAGVFINKDDSRSDLFVVGKVSPSKLNNFIKYLEAQICKELNFVVMTPEEFKYRYKMFDRFVRDMLDFPHKKLISRIKISE